MLAACLLLLAASGPPDLAAVGVVVASAPERSAAILRSNGRTRVVSVGDTVFGGRVLAVTRRQVVLEFGGERVVIAVRGSRPRPPSPAAGGPPAAPATARSRTPLRWS